MFYRVMGKVMECVFAIIPFVFTKKRAGYILKKISLDEMGLCRECILLDLPESEKESIKKWMRMEFEERDQWPEKYN